MEGEKGQKGIANLDGGVGRKVAPISFLSSQGNFCKLLLLGSARRHGS